MMDTALDSMDKSFMDIILSDLFDCAVVLVVWFVLASICYRLVPWQKISREFSSNPKISFTTQTIGR